jgi:hypothetical protein
MEMAAPTSAPTDRPQELSARESLWFSVIRRLAFTCYGALVVYAMVSLDLELLLPVVQLPLLYVVSRWLADRIGRALSQAWVAPLLLAAFEFKMVGTLLRTAVNNAFFGGMTDARLYNHYGKIIASSFRSLNFDVSVGKVEGTGFMRLVTGIVYSFWGESMLGAGLLFSWLAFLGMVLLWLAFRESVSKRGSRRYGHLLFFLPSMIYWPSALGKDALAICFLGMASFGLSRLIRARMLTGIPFLVLGTTGLIYLRPHVALTIFAGALLAIAFWKSSEKSSRTSTLRVVLLCGFSLMTMIVIGRTEQFFGVSKLDPETVSQTLESTSERTGEAGSAFTPIRMTNPVTAVPAIVTVIYRPFPFETRNFVGLLAGGEGLLLIVVTIRSRRRLSNLLRAMRTYVYPAYALGMTLGFVFAFSSFSNFGILARQRTQMLPLFLVLLCIPTRAEMNEEAALDDVTVAERLGGSGLESTADSDAATLVTEQPVPAGAHKDAGRGTALPVGPRYDGGFLWAADEGSFDFGITGSAEPGSGRGTRAQPGTEDAPAFERIALVRAEHRAPSEREFIECVRPDVPFEFSVGIASVGADGECRVEELVGVVSLPSPYDAVEVVCSLELSDDGVVTLRVAPEDVALVAENGGYARCRVFVARAGGLELLFGVGLFVEDLDEGMV